MLNTKEKTFPVENLTESFKKITVVIQKWAKVINWLELSWCNQQMLTR